jgi:two-component system LytT family response regulator
MRSKQNNYLIVEDEFLGAENLKILLQRIDNEHSNIFHAESIQKAEKILREHEIDIVFLDIKLRNELGFDLLKKIKNKKFATIIISGDNQYGITALKYGVIDYILKPYDSKELKEAIIKAKQFLATHKELETKKIENTYPDKIKISNMHGFLLLNIEDIIRLESLGNYTKIIYYKQGQTVETIISKTMKLFEPMLDPNIFFRCHRSHIINLKLVEEYNTKDGSYILLKNNDRVDLSRYKINEFVEIINKWYESL